jgi:hypothetical protein
VKNQNRQGSNQTKLGFKEEISHGELTGFLDREDTICCLLVDNVSSTKHAKKK